MAMISMPCRVTVAPSWTRLLAGEHARRLDVAIVLLIAAYTVARMPGLTHWPPAMNDEGRDANLFWVAATLTEAISVNFPRPRS